MTRASFPVRSHSVHPPLLRCPDMNPNTHWKGNPLSISLAEQDLSVTPVLKKVKSERSSQFPGHDVTF